MPTYRFRPVALGDLALLDAWRREPHVARWWGDEPYTAEKLGEPRVAMRIVELGRRPFAFVQDYDARGWPEHHFAHLPPGSRGMDLFIGDPAMLGRGHGIGLVARRMDELFAAGAPRLAVDPHPHNARAIAVYRRVGFRVAGEPRETEWGTILPMEASRRDMERERIGAAGAARARRCPRAAR